MTDTLPAFLLHWAERTPDAVFITEPDRGRAWTYVIHGSGSPAAEWLQMYREYDLDRAAKHVDGLVMGR